MHMERRGNLLHISFGYHISLTCVNVCVFVISTHTQVNVLYSAHPFLLPLLLIVSTRTGM